MQKGQRYCLPCSKEAQLFYWQACTSDASGATAQRARDRYEDYKRQLKLLDKSNWLTKHITVHCLYCGEKMEGEAQSNGVVF